MTWLLGKQLQTKPKFSFSFSNRRLRLVHLCQITVTKTKLKSPKINKLGAKSEKVLSTQDAGEAGETQAPLFTIPFSFCTTQTLSTCVPARGIPQFPGEL